MPDAGNKEGEEEIAISGEGSAPVPAQRDVNVIPEPGGKADMPAGPEITQAGGEVGIVEVQDQVEAHDLGHAARHVRVTAEIKEYLPAKSHGAEEQRRRAEGPGVVIYPLDVERQVVGQRELFEEADQEKRSAIGEILQAHRRELIELRQEMPGALDRPGHELREEANEGGKAEEIALAMHLSEVEINRVAKGLKGEEGEADRQQVLETKGHQYGRVGQLQRHVEPGEQDVQILREKARVFEEDEQR